MTGLNKGRKLAEGKTKIIFEHPSDHSLVIVENKDDITAGDGARRNVIEGKGAIACATACNCFRLLNARGIATHFVKQLDEAHMLVKKCRMIPLEVVARRIATGSFLKRNPGVSEGTRFDPLVIEFFLKDDARHDPMISEGEIVGQAAAGQAIASRTEVELMKSVLTRVFLELEKAWASKDVALVDLKIEFGRTLANELVVADVIDNDSWRLWPHGEKKEMLDKQIYRNLPKDAVNDEALGFLKQKYARVAELTGEFM